MWHSSPASPVLEGHETSFSPVHLAEPAEMMSANPAGLAFCLFTTMSRKTIPKPRSSVEHDAQQPSTLLANAGPCPSSPHQITQQTRAGLIHIRAGERDTPPLPSPCSALGTCLLGHVSWPSNTQEDFEVPTLVRTSSSTLEADGWYVSPPTPPFGPSL